MNDNEVRDMIGRSLEFGKKFGIAWDLLVETRRIVAAAAGNINVPAGDYLPRASLSIAVSSSLRSSRDVCYYVSASTVAGKRGGIGSED